jgi:type I restriction enzyme S subunit
MSFPRYPAYKDSGVEWLGEVPEHWTTMRLKYLLAEVDRRAGEENLELLGLSKSLGVLPRSQIEQSASESFDYTKYKVTDPGHLVMNKMQAWNGVFGLAPSRGMVSPDYSVFRFIEPGREGYLESLLRTEVFAGVCYTRSRGMGTAFLRLNTGDLLDIRIPSPPLDEIPHIRGFLDRETAKIDALVAEQERLIALLQEKRQAVISHAVTKGLDPDVPMKDSGVEWLGEVPGHWETWKLAHAFRAIGSGTTPPSSEHHWYEDGTVPWVTTGELRENVITETSKRVTGEALQAFSALRVHPAESLIIAMYGATIGRLGILGVDATTNQACCVLSGARTLAVRFVFYWLVAFKEQLISIYATGGGQPNINQETVAALRIPAPDLVEQADIAAFLDRETARIEGLVAEAERAIDLLKERRAALISAAVTGQIDIRDQVAPERGRVAVEGANQ